MNKKDFTILLRAVIRAEMKPMITEIVQTTIAKEFKLLREALVATPTPSKPSKPSKPSTRAETRDLLSEEINIDELMQDDRILLQDIMEQDEDLPSPSQAPKLFKGDNVFTNMLQKTVDEGYRVGTMQNQAPEGGQNLVQIEGAIDKSEIANALGYGDMVSPGAPSSPGRIVQIPQTNPEGKPINPNSVPEFLLKAMNKDYSKDLKNLKENADRNRNGLGK